MSQTENHLPVLGILGGGQLGRMIAQAAARFGIQCHVFTPESGSPASQVSARTFVASYDDETALRKFADSVDVITLEFENIPVETIRFLKQFKPVFPDDRILSITQDRVAEKSFCNDLGIKTALWHAASSAEDLRKAIDEIGVPSIMKTVRFGYDGKGQAKISSGTDPYQVWFSNPSAPYEKVILEGFVDFVQEISIIVARDFDGKIAVYPAAENIHRNHILAETHIPARITEATEKQAAEIARTIATELNLVGVLCIELFVMQDGSLLVNEMAPRPHNSGHWTIDAAPASQFEQMVRIAARLPLGGTDALSPCVMENLIGDDWLRWKELSADPNNRVHLYGKAEARVGRKMGHVTRIIRPD